MPRKNDSAAEKPFAVSTLTITAITLACLVIGAYALYKIVVGKDGSESVPLPAPPLPSASKTTDLDTFDYNGAVTDLDGTEKALSTLKGKVVFLNFWASWCPPCIAELPDIQRLHRMTADSDGIVLLLVTTEDAESVRTFMARRDYDFPVYIARNPLLDAFRVKAYPATFVLDRKGGIRFKHMGAAKWDTPAFLDYLRDLAGNPS
ncbi:MULTISPECIES: TlpA family protein disulfide reductase [Desulfococcus]|jgi:thiol-disulfide isomerase/thioredoxin|uniref:Putative alkyl hydroperoxide reductase/ Thiol specific antioxidant/ Mal allergen n=1 Tax=Desulfococcus multivorans DSM 2059 TaxID=1121405 RepID=S7V413_DESML|nr:TlpA disulfide reductase family protein [Desulfococcus multivorans]AOY58164.1 putative thioredoxin-like protein [Desulfococcus multivorans]AQV00516.1 hypothetical protein B2D07_06845 [Desulfococcus multivorans]EPR41269.1 putative alkyl hydroperoxide reductase/ Thiol specific antioxidant/ Mal allergen [Desulfococcus multivorans DSM 2059]MDX9818513.1 TlpA disulfide reductase family protein [Desulfococcus multivorans]SJZ74325.1 Thiol-disulfide isomerase or thioredoxin [Desulfococcus multivoran